MQDRRPHEPKNGNVDWELPIADGIANWIANFLPEHNNGARMDFAGTFDLGGENKYEENLEWEVIHASSKYVDCTAARLGELDEMGSGTKAWQDLWQTKILIVFN